MCTLDEMASYGLCKTILRVKKSTSVQQYTSLRDQTLKTGAVSTIHKHFVTRQKIWCEFGARMRQRFKKDSKLLQLIPCLMFNVILKKVGFAQRVHNRLSLSSQ